MNAPPDTAALDTAALDTARVALAKDGAELTHGGRAPDVVIGPDDDPLSLAGQLPSLEVIAVEFPKFNDGRGYTHARRLREELGYTGELRAVGDVGVDQLHYLLRVGFDAFSLRPGTSVEAARAALRRFGHFYVGIEAKERAAF